MKLPTTFETAFHTYTRDSQLGEGGSGTVFAVHNQLEPTLHFALKLLRPIGLTGRKLARFQNEIAFCSSATVVHPNVIRVLDSGFVQIDGTKCPFYVMPLYPTTLRKWTASSPPAERRLEVFARILDGVEAAHLRNTWHRDLKPENVLLEPDTKAIVIADFGVAHFHEDFLAAAVETSPQDRLANFVYAAPEQRIPGGTVDARCDIYALGLMLNELFTGHVPHGSNAMKIASVQKSLAYLDDVVDLMTRQHADERLASIDTVKKRLLTQRSTFISLQKLSELKSTVVPATAIDSPLVTTPVAISSFDFNGGVLTFTVNHVLPSDWQEVFRNINYRTCVWNKEPARYTLRGNKLSIASSADEAQRVADQTKRFLEIANNDYAARLQYVAQKHADQQRRELELQRAREEERQKVLSSLRI